MPRVRVDGGRRLHEPVDVGHRHQHLDGAAGRRLGDRELVQVTRVVVVDRGPQERAEVALGGVADAPGRRHAGDLGHHGRGEVRQEPALGHGPARDGSEVVPMRSRLAHRREVSCHDRGDVEGGPACARKDE